VIFKDELVTVDLTADERQVLVTAMAAWKWGSPTCCTEEFAVAMGFEGVRDLKIQAERLEGALDRRQALVPLDWARVLVATEFAFASDVVGVGTDWVAVSDMSDEQTVGLLRQLQRKLIDTAGKVRSGALWARGRPAA
jgi:hypothetical protein